MVPTRASSSCIDFCISSIFSSTNDVCVDGTVFRADAVVARPESIPTPRRILRRFTEVNQHLLRWNDGCDLGNLSAHELDHGLAIASNRWWAGCLVEFFWEKFLALDTKL
jgi:hypothetical protein